jgi:DNA-binding helix-hairpin-helix protein with protein kinase domain
MHMRLICQTNGVPVQFEPDQLLGSGGQANVYAVADNPLLAAKVYHKPNAELVGKLEVMIQNPPLDPLSGKGHASIAWPVDLLAEEKAPKRPVGFLMPRVNRVRPIIEFYNPKSRRASCPGFNYLYLHRTARNLATAIHALHVKGYVIGDVNESNILVSDTALVTMVDVDSFQVEDKRRAVIYPCPVGRPDITPAELLAQLRSGKTFQDLSRKPNQDAFGLAVLIFQVLMEGTHPFSGVYTGDGEPPALADRIVAGHFPYDTQPGIPYRPMALSPLFLNLHPSLRELFKQCFISGHAKPAARPTALQWQQALDLSARTLIICKKNAQHFYWDHVQKCPWCERTQKLGGRDPFPFIPGESVSTIGSDGQLAAIKLPPTGPQVVAPPAPDAPVRLKLSSQRAYHPRTQRITLGMRLARLLRLESHWQKISQTAEGRHFQQHWPSYLFLILVMLGYPLFSGLLPTFGFLYGLTLMIAGLAWFHRRRTLPWKRKWQPACLGIFGAFAFAHGIPWAQVVKALTQI